MFSVADSLLHYYQEHRTMSVVNRNIIYNELQCLTIMKYAQGNQGHTEEGSVIPKGNGKLGKCDRKGNSDGSQYMSQSLQSENLEVDYEV